MTWADITWVIAAVGFLAWAGGRTAGWWLRDIDPDEDDTDHPHGP
jgi:hypothetical protein